MQYSPPRILLAHSWQKGKHFQSLWSESICYKIQVSEREPRSVFHFRHKTPLLTDFWGCKQSQERRRQVNIFLLCLCSLSLYQVLIGSSGLAHVKQFLILLHFTILKFINKHFINMSLWRASHILCILRDLKTKAKSYTETRLLWKF